MKTCHFIAMAIMLFSLTSRAQTIHRLTTETQYGFIIPHASDLKQFSNTRPTGLHLSWQLMNTKKNHWEACHCFHYLGARFSYIDFGAENVLGKSFTLSGTFEPVLWRRNNWALNLNSGIGITYLTHTYDPETNPTNNFFSTKISFLLFVAPTIEYQFSKKWKAHLSLNYNHISNGGQDKPNRGMNFPQAGMGVNYYFNHAPLPEYPMNEPDDRWMYWLETGITTRNVGQTNNKQPSASLIAGAKRPVSTINGLGGGVEINRDYSLQKESGNYGKTISAPFISHHFLLGRFDFNQRMAWYVHQPEEMEGHRFYQRYVLFFRMVSDFHVGVSLKAHGHVATHLDLRLGWQF